MSKAELVFFPKTFPLPDFPVFMVKLPILPRGSPAVAPRLPQLLDDHVFTAAGRVHIVHVICAH